MEKSEVVIFNPYDSIFCRQIIKEQENNFIKEASGEHSLTCRMGGDEFAIAVAFNKDTPESEINTRAKVIFEGIKNAIYTYNGCALSMGGAISTDKIKTFSALYDKSDQKLYVSKDKGGNQLTL